MSLKQTIFICYAREDKEIADIIDKHLRPYIEENYSDSIEIWIDRDRLSGGVDINIEIEKAMDRSICAILLMSKSSMEHSSYCRTEIRYLKVLKERKGDKLVLLPVILDDCKWKYIIRENIFYRPIGDKTYLKKDDDGEIEVICKDVVKHINKNRQCIYTESLPTIESDLIIGRDDILNTLDEAWEKPNQYNIYVIKGWAGYGKTALVDKWLDKKMAPNYYRGATNVLVWSFFGQSQQEDVEEQDMNSIQDRSSRSSGLCIRKLLNKVLECRRPSDSSTFSQSESYSSTLSDWENVERLVKILIGDNQTNNNEIKSKSNNSRCSLLVLDGLEVFQSNDTLNKGKVIDALLSKLLESLALQSNVLTVITSRIPFHLSRGLDKHIFHIDLDYDPDNMKDQTFTHSKPYPISKSDAYEIIKSTIERLNKDFASSYKIGKISEWEKVLSVLSGLKFNPLILKLFATFVWLKPISPDEGLKILNYKDHENEKIVQPDNENTNSTVYKIMDLIDRKLPDKGVTLSNILNILMFFRSPIDLNILKDICKNNKLKDFSSALSQNSDDDWAEIISTLRSLNLITYYEDYHGIDIHPLVRNYFKEKLLKCKEKPCEENFKKWKEYHNDLYEFYKDKANSQQSITDSKREYSDFQHLYDSVYHGCLAEKYNETWHFLWEEIHKKFEHIPGNQFGLWSADLSTLSHFFKQTWDLPFSGLDRKYHAYIFNEVGFDLRSMARLEEAVEPTQRALDIVYSIGDWETATTASGNLSKIYLSLGRITEAIEKARDSISFSDKLKEHDNKHIWQVASRAWLGEALHAAGHFWESESAFRSAEVRSINLDNKPLEDESLFRYCELLLDQAEFVWKGLIEFSEGCLTSINHTPAQTSNKSDVDLNNWDPKDEAIEKWDPHYKSALNRFRQIRDLVQKYINSSPDKPQARLHTALSQLTYGRASLLMYNFFNDAPIEEKLKPPQDMRMEYLEAAQDNLVKAVDSLRYLGHQIYLPRSLLSLAAIRRIQGTLDKEYINQFKIPGLEAKRFEESLLQEKCFKISEDILLEALEIITRGHMKLFEADYHLELARLHLAYHQTIGKTGHRRQVQLSLEDANALIHEIGYARRQPELTELRQNIKKTWRLMDSSDLLEEISHSGLNQDEVSIASVSSESK